jgi:hypothetical protein
VHACAYLRAHSNTRMHAILAVTRANLVRAHRQILENEAAACVGEEREDLDRGRTPHGSLEHGGRKRRDEEETTICSCDSRMSLTAKMNTKTEA